MCTECLALYRGWLRYLTDQGPVTGWVNYPPANGSDRRIARDRQCYQARIDDRVALVREQLSRVARTCTQRHRLGQLDLFEVA